MGEANRSQGDFERREAVEAGGFVRQSLFSLAAQVFGFACGFAAGIVIARALGPEGRGVYSLVVAAGAMAASVASLGMPFAVTYYVGRERWQPVAAALLAFACSLLALDMLVAAIGAAGPERVARLAGLSPAVMQLAGLYIAAWLPLQIASRIGEGLLRARELIVSALWPGMAAAAARLALLVGLFWLVGRRPYSAVVADIAAAGVGAGLLAIVAWAHLLHWPAGYTAPPSARRLLSYGVQNQLGAIFYMLTLRLDLFLVNYFLGEGPTGIYSVSMAFAELAAFPTRAVGFVLFPRLVRLDTQERRSFALEAQQGLVWASVGASLLLLAAIPLIPVIYGQKFAPSALPAAVCLLGMPFWGAVTVVHYLFLAENRIAPALASYPIGMAAMVAIDVALIPRMGVVAAAIGYVVCLIAIYASSAAFARAMFGVNMFGALLPSRAAMARLVRLGVEAIKRPTVGPGR